MSGAVLINLELDVSVCRTCLSPEAALQLWGECAEAGLTLGGMLAALTGVPAPHVADGLPPALCAACARCLHIAAAFRRRARDADSSLRASVAAIQLSADSDLIHQPHTPHNNTESFEEELIEKVVTKRGRADGQQCGQCGYMAASCSALTAHARTHSGERPYVCAECGRGFTSRGNLRRHAAAHGPRQRRFVCEMCGRGFYRKSDILSHLRIHSGETPYHCPLCDRQFRQLASLSRHKRAHSGERPCACPQCGKRFADAHLVRKHQLVHSNERNFVCHLCSKSVKSMSALTSHVALHRAERSHVCPHCSRAFSLKGNLMKHIRRLHGAPAPGPPAACATCDARFSSVRAARAHAAARHTPPSHGCTAQGCEAAFPLARMLRHHMLKSHAGSPPLQCPAAGCTRAFYRASDCSRHLRAAHPDTERGPTPSQPPPLMLHMGAQHQQ